MSLLPIFCNLSQKSCLVVGGGNVAYHKIELLLAANANVIALAPNFCHQMHELATVNSQLNLITEYYQQKWLTGCWLVFAATNDPQINKLIAKHADEQQIFCNIADAPEIASFFNPTVIDKSPVLVAVSTSGYSPVYNQILKEKISKAIPPDAQDKLLLASRFREQVKQRFASREEKRQFWQHFFSDPRLNELLAKNNPQEIEDYITGLINI